jgi:hypothetical protein
VNRRPAGDRAGSGFDSGRHVELELTCPSNHLLIRIGNNLRDGAEYEVWPAPAAERQADGRMVSRTKTWREYDADTEPTSLTLWCNSCSSEDRYRLDRVRAVLRHLEARGEPIDLRLTKARFDDVSRRLLRP